MNAVPAHYFPDDSVFREDAIERLAEGLVKDGEVALLLEELLDAGLLPLLSDAKWYQSERVTLAQRIRSLERNLEGAIDDLRRRHLQDLTP